MLNLSNTKDSMQELAQLTTTAYKIGRQMFCNSNLRICGTFVALLCLLGAHTALPRSVRGNPCRPIVLCKYLSLDTKLVTNPFESHRGL